MYVFPLLCSFYVIWYFLKQKVKKLACPHHNTILLKKAICIPKIFPTHIKHNVFEEDCGVFESERSWA